MLLVQIYFQNSYLIAPARKSIDGYEEYAFKLSRYRRTAAASHDVRSVFADMCVMLSVSLVINSSIILYDPNIPLNVLALSSAINSVVICMLKLKGAIWREQGVYCTAHAPSCKFYA